MSPRRKTPQEINVQAIENGTVIDHLPSETTLAVFQILSRSDDMVAIGINLSSKKIGRKGFVKFANKMLTPEEVNKIAVIAPSASVNIIKHFKVVRKVKVTIPDVVEGILRCTNPHCITNHEKVRTRFHSSSDREKLNLRCHYCERTVLRSDAVVI
ncbi:MAG: aspartate carbamoyltransferase regulatory subunit [Planctomycetota bacterium]